MADTKISALTANTTPLAGDYLVQVDDPAGTPPSKRMTIGDISIANGPVQGGLINGYISRTVASNDLIVAIKTLAGADPSATDPVYCRIGNSVRTISAALSVTMADGADTFGLGGNGCLTDQDLFVYLGFRAASSTVFIGVARYAHGLLYSDFSGTATAQGYLAYSGSAPAATDEVENIGRVNATNSGTAAYNWSVPATSVVISRPIFMSRLVDYTPTHAGYSANPTNTIYKYKVELNRVMVYCLQGTAGTSNATTTTMTAPFTAVTLTNGAWRTPIIPAVDNSTLQTTPGVAQLATASATMSLFKTCDTGSNTWTNSGSKRTAFFELWYPIA